MKISKEDFIRWTDDPVTKEVFKVIQDRIEEAKEFLAAAAGEDAYNDRLLVGMIRAFREIQEISFEE